MAKWVLRISILVAIYLAIYKYSDWGWGSILSGVGVLAIGSFISFLLAKGKNLNENDDIFATDSLTPIDSHVQMGNAAAKSTFRLRQRGVTYSENNDELVKTELVYLIAFIVDLSAYQAFQESRSKTMIMDAYYNALSSKGVNIQTCNERVVQYSEKYREDPPKPELGIYYNIGKAFSTIISKNTISDPFITLETVKYMMQVKELMDSQFAEN
ncbi:hypothetical protein [Paenibacillus sp. FSL K6-0108]|uniref:hypothetical protein n=1 Tax=Paenibacillus sp. FSL K6-0108 TaxID=2921417 RepID=UPI00324E734A